MDVQVFLFFYLSSLKFAWCTVILSGGPYCSSDGNPVATFAVPDDTISITCVVDNPNGGQNILIWDIPLFGVSITNANGVNGVDANQPEFQSVVNDFDNTEDTTNATLSFPAVTGLDGAVVTCQDNNSPAESSNCTLFISTPPSAPTSFMCTNITNGSLTLQWGKPTDNGGEDVSLYFYNITGKQKTEDINIINIVQSENYVTLGENNITHNTTYYFTVSANNSLGFGEEATVNCTTESNKPPPMFDNVTVCLDFNTTGDNNLNPTLVVEALPCPLSTKAEEFTPEITDYSVKANGSSIFVEEDPGVCNFIATVNPGVYTVDVCASNNVGTSKTSYDNGSVFYALWLRDVRVMDITNSSAAIHYTTADCVERDELLNIELVVPSVTTATSQYYTSTSSSFTLTSLMQDDTVVFTLQVVVTSTRVIVASTIGSFIVSSTEETTTPSSSISITTTTDTSSTSISTTGPTESTTDVTSTSTSTSSNTLPIIGGVVGAILGIVAIVIIILAAIACYVYYKNKKNKTSVDLLNIGGSSSDPIPLRETKRPLPETGQALYQDPDTIKRQQAPTGDLYAQPDKPRRQPPPGPSSATETVTYQDPNTIERQLAPTGDMYAMPQKKPQYSKVDKANKGHPAMYAELGFEDGSQPPISPSGQPLLPKDKAQVMYADVRGQ